MLYWNPDTFLVGIETIDQQHMSLFKAINEIHSAYQRRDGSTRLIELLDFLKQYVQTHFGEEQRLMKQYNYPGLPEQISQHEYFMEELSQFRLRLENEGDNLGLAIELFSKTGNWLVEHISIEDKKMGDYIKTVMSESDSKE